MQSAEQCTFDNQVICFNPNYVTSIDPDFFDPSHWRGQDALIGEAKGRGTTFFFQYNQQQMVLRHYRRGGLVGKLISDSYLFSGIKHTRAWQEFQLLMKLAELNLPAPQAVAARITKVFFTYQADLVTLRIDDASDAFELLSHNAFEDQTWYEIGHAIGQFHQQQVFHHDLNIHNIMLDENDKVWLIDFDKCGFKKGQGWKAQNLDRLLRSLRKEKAKNSNFHWQEEQWKILIDGYLSMA